MAKEKSTLQRLFNVQSAFFIPVWRRVVVVAASAGWSVVEWMNDSPGWAVLFLAIAVYCGHQFFVAFDPPEDGG